jgi:hypothetical protein
MSSFPRLKVERKRKLLKAKLTKLKEEGGGGGAGGGVTGGGDSAGNSLLEDPASLAEFKKHKKTKEFRSENRDPNSGLRIRNSLIGSGILLGIRIWICRIFMFLSIPDRDPLVRGIDPDPDPSLFP